MSVRLDSNSDTKKYIHKRVLHSCCLLCGVQTLQRNELIQKAVAKRRIKAKRFKKAIARVAVRKFDEYVVISKDHLYVSQRCMYREQESQPFHLRHLIDHEY